MLGGLALAGCVGLLWVLVGVILSRVSAARISAPVFYAVGCWLAAGFACVCLTDWSLLLQGGQTRVADLVLCVGAAGVVNAAGQMLLVAAMGQGHKGVSWAIVQMAMLLPYLASVLLWQEPLTLSGVGGMALLMGGLLLMGASRAGGVAGGGGMRWLFFVTGAFLLIGVSQAMQSVPSHWQGWSDAARLRPSVMLLGGAVANTLWVLLRRERIRMAAVRLGAIWAVVAVASYLLLFLALDTMAAARISGYAFPVAQVTCMIGFSLYSALALREAFSWRVRLGMIGGLVGMFLLVWSPSVPAAG